MWPLPQLNKNIVTITFHPQYLCCSWIIPSNKYAKLTLRAYERFPLQNLELEQLTIFNPTHIKKTITSFLQKHHLSNTCIVFGLSGPGLKEKMLTLSKASPTPDDFTLPITKDLLWDFRYLYPKENGTSIFYVYGIPQHLLFQYQLLAIAAQLNVIKITPIRMALFHAYKFFHGHAYRQGKLALDMTQYNNMIEQTFTQDSLSRLVAIPANIDKQQELAYVLQACGLFISEM